MIREERLRVELPAVIALGSNLGDREQALRDAVRAVAALSGVVVLAASGIVESPALTLDGIDEGAPSYLNAVIRVRSTLDPERLLDELNIIEKDLGRVRGPRWGARTIDLDIITAAGVTRETARLTLPHPSAFERGFVLVPWLQIEPSAVLPGYGLVADLAAQAVDEVREYPAAPLLDAVRR